MLKWSERGHVLATCDERVVYCRVVGLGNMNNCAPFQSFSVQLQKRGYREFILDFSRCDGLDSTFLGILLGIALGERDHRSKVVVVNASESIKRILGEVGIDRLVEVHTIPMQLPEIPMQRLDRIGGRDADRIQMILEAHENLCRVAGSNNKERFGTFVSILREELEAKRAEESSGMSEALRDPLRLRPIPVPRVWGGDRLLRELHPELAAEPPIGETWEVSDVADDPALHSKVSAGPHAGRTLRELIHEDPRAVLGAEVPGDRLPLLFKFIDARETLSVQVHPTDALMAALGGGFGKTEAWVILDAAPDSEIVYGLEGGLTLADYVSAAREGRGHEGFRRVSVRRGDVIYLPAGVVHAIGEGILLAEIQQSSDVTYRIHDWGRLGLDGMPRRLHLDEATRVTSPAHTPVCPLPVPAATTGAFRTWISGPPFQLEILEGARSEEPLPHETGERFGILAWLAGSGRWRGAEHGTGPAGTGKVGEVPLTAGDVIFWPASATAGTLTSSADAWALWMTPRTAATSDLRA